MVHLSKSLQHLKSAIQAEYVHHVRYGYYIIGSSEASGSYFCWRCCLWSIYHSIIKNEAPESLEAYHIHTINKITYELLQGNDQ